MKTMTADEELRFSRGLCKKQIDKLKKLIVEHQVKIGYYQSVLLNIDKEINK